MRIKMNLSAKSLFGRGDAKVDLEADTIEDMEKLIELANKINVNVRMS